MKNKIIPVIILDAYSFKPKSEAIWLAPLSKKTINSDINAILIILNLASQQIIIAVNPLPPAVCLEIVCDIPATSTNPATPANPPDNKTVRIIVLGTLIPAYFAVARDSPTTANSNPCLEYFK